MIPDLIPPTLEDMGFILWGADRRTPIATSLELTDEELAGWEDDPVSIPEGNEARLVELCVIRSREIGKMHDRLKAAGLRRAGRLIMPTPEGWRRADADRAAGALDDRLRTLSTKPGGRVQKVSFGGCVSCLVGSRRWWALWFVLLGLSATAVPYFDNGAPTSWPSLLRVAIGIFLAPGGLIWMALFWRAFGGGPAEIGRVFIVLMNSTVWLLLICTAIWILGRLRAR